MLNLSMDAWCAEIVIVLGEEIVYRQTKKHLPPTLEVITFCSD